MDLATRSVSTKSYKIWLFRGAKKTNSLTALLRHI